MESLHEKIVDIILKKNPVIIDAGVYIFNENTGICNRIDTPNMYCKIAGELEKKDAVRATDSTYRRAYSAVKCQAENVVQKIDLGQIEGRKNCIAFRNGIYKFENSKIEKIDNREAREYYLLRNLKCGFVIPEFDGDRVKGAPNFSKFIDSSFGAEAATAERAVLEILGYIFTDCTEAHKAFFLTGMPRSGKSVILKFVEEIVGDEYVSAIPLNRLGERFNVAQLYGKVVNICGEVPTGAVRDIAAFKAVVSGDRLKGEYKNNPDLFEFTPTLKLLTAGNHLPQFEVSDGTASCLERMHVLHFPKTIARDERDTDM